MPLEPRFRRVAALHRSFVDRETAIAAFAEVLSVRQGSPCVFNVVGVGGIGKSRLLREFGERSAETHRVATLDLQIPAMRQQEDALAVLRVELGRQGVRFDRFDIAYAVLWQRLHPHLRLSRNDLPFVDESEALSQIIDGAAGVPVFGTGVGLLRLLGKARSGMRQRHRIKSDETLSQLDDLTNAELADAVTYLFAEDLRDGSDCPYVIFVDAYEALGTSSAGSGRATSQDVWLRDLIAQLDSGVVVVASREPLTWTAHDPGWADVIRHQPVDGLPMAARLELLADGGITDHSARHAIATASQGLPFYLHLAVDTRTTAHQAAVVSSEEILQRFLAHVGPDEIRTLELLSVARVFDFEIFQAVADAFDLPRHRMAWESLTAYSFVYPAGPNGCRLHQLMRTALHRRLSEGTAQDVQAVLRRVWDARAAQSHAAENGVATRTRAIREAAFCGLHAGALSGEDLLAYADQAMTSGGKHGVDGITQDLREHLDTGGGGGDEGDLVQTARCLAAESAVLLGDAEAATRLTPSIDWPLDDIPGARLALAGAHGRRIAGATGEAQRLFRQLWNQHSGRVRLRAGYCMADLDMCQGRFGDALSITQQILADAPDDDLVLRGDVARLQHLGYRFGFDLDASARSLETAAELYTRAGAIIGQADIKTNRAELLAWTDPSGAIDAAADAIEVQTELGAHHEIGKAFTALAIAQCRLGQHAPAAASFQSATEALERARYRSGRARAELFRAFLHARTGDTTGAAASTRWAIAELVAAEVYPTLLMVAGHLLNALDAADEHTAAVTERARAQISPPNLLAFLDERANALVTAMLENG